MSPNTTSLTKKIHSISFLTDFLKLHQPGFIMGKVMLFSVLLSLKVSFEIRTGKVYLKE